MTDNLRARDASASKKCPGQARVYKKTGSIESVGPGKQQPHNATIFLYFSPKIKSPSTPLQSSPPSHYFLLLLFPLLPYTSTFLLLLLPCLTLPPGVSVLLTPPSPPSSTPSLTTASSTSLGLLGLPLPLLPTPPLQVLLVSLLLEVKWVLS